MKRLMPVVLVAVACQAPDPEWHRLQGEVEVRRDEWGVAHIYAKDSDDALYALGYETARDRLFQLDLLRRRAQGRAAELLGAQYTADDRIARTLGFAQLGADGAKDLRTNDPVVHRALSAYAAGISAYLKGGALPPEYADLDADYRPSPWTVADTVAMTKAELFLLAAHPETDLLYFAIQASGGDGPKIATDLWAPDPMEAVYITPGFGSSGPTAQRHTPVMRKQQRATARAAAELADAFAHHSGRGRIGPVAASNNLALCPKLTASGGTLFENDPHLGLDLPGNLYEVHFESDTLRVAGFGIPGLPALVNGHNANIAWGVTTVEADTADTYLEIVEGDSVVFKGERVAMQVREEKIVTRRAGGKVGEGDEETLRVRVVPHHGPLISDAVPDVQLLLGNKGLSIKWPGFEVTHEARAHYDLMRAKSWAEFQAALNHQEAGLLNFVYAGADGDIGYYPHATYPIRAKLDAKNPPFGVLPGGGQYEWTGERIPDAKIPQLHNPDSCRIFTANNDPAGVTADRDVLNDTYYLGGTFDYGHRAKRIETMLAAVKGDATLETLEQVQDDVHSGLAEHFVPRLLAAVGRKPPSPAAAALASQLAGWNREYARDAVEPTVFAAWYAQLISDVFADDLPLTFDRASGDDRWFASLLERLLRGETALSGHDYLGGVSPDDAMLGALEKVAASSPLPRWGAVHTATFNHPLGGRYDVGPVELSGGLETLSCARYAQKAGVPGGDVVEGPNVRMVVELGKSGVTMRAALPTGQSMVVGDAHYADQLPLWKDGQTRACHFERDDVVAHAADVTVLKP